MSRKRPLRFKNNLAYDDVTERWYGRVMVDGSVRQRAFGTKTEAELWVDSMRGRPRRLPPVPWDETEMKNHFRSVLRGAKQRAQKPGVEVSITLAQLMAMLRQSGGRCTLTGIPFSFAKIEGAWRRPWVPSIDRIEPGGPYSKDNCRLVCSAVNTAMNQWGLEALYRIADGLLLGELFAARHNWAEALKAKEQKR